MGYKESNMADMDRRLFNLMDANRSGDVDEKEFMAFVLALSDGCQNAEERKFILKFIKSVGEIMDGGEGDTLTWEMWDGFEPPEGRFTEGDLSNLAEAVEWAEANTTEFKTALERFRAMDQEQAYTFMKE